METEDYYVLISEAIKRLETSRKPPLVEQKEPLPSRYVDKSRRSSINHPLPPQRHPTEFSTSPRHTRRQNVLQALGEAGSGTSQGSKGREDAGMAVKANTGMVSSTSNQANETAAPG